MADADWSCSLQELAQVTGGNSMSNPRASFSRVGTDTRADLQNKLFVPLKGENHDAHDFVPKAVAAGAAAVMISQWRDEWQPLLQKASFVRVADTLQGLQALARAWRKKHGFKVVAVTGSNGKTSTKEFTQSLLRRHFPTHAAKGSFNNHWGVPLTILDASPNDKVLILEMGMNKAGEIFRLCQIAEPDIVAVTTVGRAHIGELGSQLNVAQAKEEIYTAAPKAVHVFNMDNEWTMRMQSRSHAQQIKFSAFRATDVDVHFRAQRITWEGLDLIGQIRGSPGQTWIHVLGRQNTVNLMCAASLALAVGLNPAQIWQGLAEIKDGAWGRNQSLLLQNGAHVLFDAYNANPDSLSALLKNLYEIETPGRKFLVMGDMLELGSFSESAHEEAGERAGGVGFSGVWYVGRNSKPFVKGLQKAGLPTLFFASEKFDPKIAKEFSQELQPGDLVALKGSRGVHLEEVVESWPLQTPLGKKPG